MTAERMTLADLAGRLSLAEDDYRELFEIFIDSGLSDFDTLLTSLHNGDAAGVVRDAHSLRGAALNLGLDSFAEIAERIEDKARAGDLTGAGASLLLLGRRLRTLAGLVRSGPR